MISCGSLRCGADAVVLGPLGVQAKGRGRCSNMPKKSGGGKSGSGKKKKPRAIPLVLVSSDRVEPQRLPINPDAGAASAHTQSPPQLEPQRGL